MGCLNLYFISNSHDLVFPTVRKMSILSKKRIAAFVNLFCLPFFAPSIIFPSKANLFYRNRNMFHIENIFFCFCFFRNNKTVHFFASVQKENFMAICNGNIKPLRCWILNNERTKPKRKTKTVLNKFLGVHQGN